MAVTWKIDKMFRSPTFDGKSDVVRVIKYTATSELTKSGKSANFEKKGEAVLDVSDLSSFTSFDSVSESQALGWLTTALGAEKDKIETDLEMQSEYSLSPNSVSGLPWYTPESEPTIPPIIDYNKNDQTGGDVS